MAEVVELYFEDSAAKIDTLAAKLQEPAPSYTQVHIQVAMECLLSEGRCREADFVWRAAAATTCGRAAGMASAGWGQWRQAAGSSGHSLGSPQGRDRAS